MEKFDATKIWSREAKASTNQISAPRKGVMMTNDQIMVKINSSSALKETFSMKRADIITWLAIVKPGSMPVYIRHPNYRDIKSGLSAQEIKNLSAESKDLASVAALAKQPRKARVRMEGEVCVLEAMDKDKLPPKCYNVLALLRSRHMGDNFVLPKLCDSSIYLHPLEETCSVYMEIFDHCKELIKFLVAKNMVNRRVVKTTVKPPKEKAIPLLVIKLQLIEKYDELNTAEMEKLRKLREAIKKGNFLGTLLFVGFIFPVNQREIDLKAKLVEAAEKFIRAFSITSDQLNQKGIGHKMARRNLYDRAVDNVNSLLGTKKVQIEEDKDRPKFESALDEIPQVGIIPVEPKKKSSTGDDETAQIPSRAEESEEEDEYGMDSIPSATGKERQRSDSKGSNLPISRGSLVKEVQADAEATLLELAITAAFSTDLGEVVVSDTASFLKAVTYFQKPIGKKSLPKFEEIPVGFISYNGSYLSRPYQNLSDADSLKNPHFYYFDGKMANIWSLEGQIDYKNKRYPVGDYYFADKGKK